MSKKISLNMNSFGEDALEDFESYVNIVIKNQRCFKEFSGDAGEEITLKDECDAAFRRICKDKKDTDLSKTSTKHIRIEKNKLKNYLTRLYNRRLASKMIVCFDWNNLSDFKLFYTQFENRFLGRTKEENFNAAITDGSNYNRVDHMN